MDIPGYKIIQPIENGGAGSVYLATQLDTGRAVVVKYLPKSLLDHAALNKYLSRFDKEGESAKQVFHPNIAEVHEVGQNLEALYSVVDYVPGESLEKRASSMCLLDKIYVVKQLADALDYLAQKKIGHYNIKPSNIILSSETSQAILTDFGFSRGMHQNSEVLLQDKLLETTDYASPEQQQKELLDARSDLYSLGAIFCFLLTGKAPFKYGYEAVGSEQVGASFVELPNELSVFQEFVDYALAKTPDDRFQSGREMIDELEKIDDEVIIAIEGHQVEKAKSKKQATPAKSNVFSLSQAAKKKQQESFKKLLMPDDKPAGEVPPKKTKNEWDDIPPTEYTNNYEYIEGLKSGALMGKKQRGEDKKINDAAAKITKPQKLTKKQNRQQGRLDKPLRPVLAKTKPKAADNVPPDANLKSNQVVSSAKVKSVRPPSHEIQPPPTPSALNGKALKKDKEKEAKSVKPAKQVQDNSTSGAGLSVDSKVDTQDEHILLDNDFVDIPQGIYQALAKEPWSHYESASDRAKYYRRRIALLFLLLLVSVAFYLTYQNVGQPAQPASGAIAPPLQKNEETNRGIDRLVLETRDKLEALQFKLREGVYDLLKGQIQNTGGNESAKSQVSVVSEITEPVPNRLGQGLAESTIVEDAVELLSGRELRRSQKQERIDWLLARAATLKSQGKLLFPADQNAVLIYKQVLELNPENFIALTEMQSIRKDTIEQINLMLELGHIGAADALLTRVNIFFKSAPPVGDLALRIREQRRLD